MQYNFGDIMPGLGERVVERDKITSQQISELIPRELKEIKEFGISLGSL
jgi:hypothetical protein